MPKNLTAAEIRDYDLVLSLHAGLHLTTEFHNDCHSDIIFLSEKDRISWISRPDFILMHIYNLDAQCSLRGQHNWLWDSAKKFGITKVWRSQRTQRNLHLHFCFSLFSHEPTTHTNTQTPLIPPLNSSTQPVQQPSFSTPTHVSAEQYTEWYVIHLCVLMLVQYHKETHTQSETMSQTGLATFAECDTHTQRSLYFSFLVFCLNHVRVKGSGLIYSAPPQCQSIVFHAALLKHHLQRANGAEGLQQSSVTHCIYHATCNGLENKNTSICWLT